MNGPHQDGRWAAEPFYADEHGRRIYQGVLVLGEGHKDGVFAYDGGKHFAYLPGAIAVVDSILEQAVEKTPTRVAGAIISVSFMSKWDW